MGDLKSFGIKGEPKFRRGPKILGGAYEPQCCHDRSINSSLCTNNKSIRYLCVNRESKRPATNIDDVMVLTLLAPIPQKWSNTLKQLVGNSSTIFFEYV